MPEDVREKVTDTRRRRSWGALPDGGRLRQLVARDDSERIHEWTSGSSERVPQLALEGCRGPRSHR